MLKIINDLRPFFEDCYRRIGVREYAKIMRLSPPTASRLLTGYHKDGVLLREKYRNYILFYANKNSKDFIDVSRIYWRHRLEDFVMHAERRLASPSIILFGSLSKGEAKADSDVDIAIFAREKKLETEGVEKKTGRKLQIFWFRTLEDATSKGLVNAIINGCVLRGKLSWTGKTVSTKK